MAFRVDETALDAAAQALTRLAADADTARTYTQTYVDLPGGLMDSGMFLNAISVLNDVRGTTEAELARLKELTEASARELRAVAQAYRASDDDSDARMDTLRGAIPGGAW